MTLEKALQNNPYDPNRGNLSAYIRYLRYTVDGWFDKESKEIRQLLFMHEAEKFRDAFMDGMNEVDEELVERIREHGRRAENELAVMMKEEKNNVQQRN